VAQLGAMMALIGGHRHGGHFIFLIILVVVIVVLVVALVRSRRSNAPVHDDWKPPVDPPKEPDA
jgi:uncharacterized membrane protein